MSPRFATDVVTFYHPGFWDLDSADAVRDWAADHPDRFWRRVLDTLAETEVTGIELTFAPGDIDSALRAYGSAEAFRRELAAGAWPSSAPSSATATPPTGGMATTFPRSSPTPSAAPPSSPRWAPTSSSPDCR